MIADKKVLDDIGFVRLVEATPDADATVVRAARVSYGKGSKTPEEDKKLIAYLLKHHHGTPFEHNSLTFHVKCPIFVMRQWVRHRIGQSFNEISGRYTEMKDEMYVPKVFRAQDTKNKQGSVDADLDHAKANAVTFNSCRNSYENYQQLLDLGVAKEMARMVLPLNLYTEFYWTVNARSLMEFIRLRSESHAQWETREYSNALADLFCQVMPWTFEAFMGSLDLSAYPNFALVGEPVAIPAS